MFKSVMLYQSAETRKLDLLVLPICLHSVLLYKLKGGLLVLSPLLAVCMLKCTICLFIGAGTHKICELYNTVWSKGFL